MTKLKITGAGGGGGGGGKGSHHHSDPADGRATLEIYLPKDKQVKDILDLFKDVSGHTKSFEGKLYIDFNTPEAAAAGLKEALKADLYVIILL